MKTWRYKPALLRCGWALAFAAGASGCRHMPTTGPLAGAGQPSVAQSAHKSPKTAKPKASEVVLRPGTTVDPLLALAAHTAPEGAPAAALPANPLPKGAPPAPAPEKSAPAPIPQEVAQANSALNRRTMQGLPRELEKTVLPEYRIEPPDILQLEAVHIAPKSPYHLRNLDSLAISVPGALPDAPLKGIYPIQPGGHVNLGPPYGSVRVGGLTVEDARAAIEKLLAKDLKDPKADVSLGEIAALQQISGPHLVGMDGNITLGSYGRVNVVGMTIEQAKHAVEAHLGKYLDAPEIGLDVYAYNSKVFYIITQGAGLGDGVQRFPVTGNETVLDAISLINGLLPNSSTRIWIARPGRNQEGCNQVLAVDWCAITQAGDVRTNYQLMPGDRVYVAEDNLVAVDNWLGKMFAPWERMFGFISLGTNTAQQIKFFHVAPRR